MSQILWARLILGLIIMVCVSDRLTAQGYELKTGVVAADANDGNTTITKVMAPAPTTTIALPLVITNPAPNDSGKGRLHISAFVAQTDIARSVPATIGIAAAKGSDLEIELAEKRIVSLELQLTGMRRGTSYKGFLTLTAGGLKPHHWDITITTGTRGTLAVDPIATPKIVTLPWRRLCVFSSCNANVTVPITLRDKNDGGPYNHVTVRFLPNTTGKAIAPIVSLGSFSFFDANRNRIDLAQGGTGNFVLNQRQQTIEAAFGLLSPGEYTGTLQFSADDTADDAAEARVPITVHVRHHWVLPLLVILLGSVIGWFSSKYVVGARKAKKFKSQIDELRERCVALSRRPTPRDGWTFSSEATSYALIRLRVVLHQLLKLTSSPLAVLLREEEIEQLRQAAARRLTALEKLHASRLRLQPVADERPAVQLALGLQLRSVMNLVERPIFSETEQADFDKLLQAAEVWKGADTFQASYRDALLDRLQSREIPDAADITSLGANHPVSAQLTALSAQLPDEAAIKAASTVRQLEQFDDALAKIALLWRECEMPWAANLADACAKGQTAEQLFQLTDEFFWTKLQDAARANELKIVRDAIRDEQLQAYEFVELHLTSTNSMFSDARILFHPLRVRWDILTPTGPKRTVESECLTLVQYFKEVGNVKINATLIWKGREIPIEKSQPLEIIENPKHSVRLAPSESTEYAVIVIAAGFAAATGINTIYDATFGSYAQYLTLFLWAAGAATGGNIFKEMGTTSTAGGRADVTLTK